LNWLAHSVENLAEDADVTMLFQSCPI